jgi:hypothetical protein
MPADATKKSVTGKQAARDDADLEQPKFVEEPKIDLSEYGISASS